MAMVLGLNATAPPTLKINPSTADFTIPGQVTVFVLDKNETAQVAFVLGTVSLCLVFFQNLWEPIDDCISTHFLGKT